MLSRHIYCRHIAIRHYMHYWLSSLRDTLHIYMHTIIEARHAFLRQLSHYAITMPRLLILLNTWYIDAGCHTLPLLLSLFFIYTHYFSSHYWEDYSRVAMLLFSFLFSQLRCSLFTSAAYEPRHIIYYFRDTIISFRHLLLFSDHLPLTDYYICHYHHDYLSASSPYIYYMSLPFFLLPFHMNDWWHTYVMLWYYRRQHIADIIWCTLIFKMSLY